MNPSALAAEHARARAPPQECAHADGQPELDACEPREMQNEKNIVLDSDGRASGHNMLRMANAEDPADQAFHEAMPPGQMREEDFTPAELRELKESTAEAIRTAYAIAVKAPADMSAAELREQLEMRDKLVTCLRAEVKALHTMIQQTSSQAGGEDGDVYNT